MLENSEKSHMLNFSSDKKNPKISTHGFNFWIFRGIPETPLKLNWSNNCQAEFYDSRGFLDGIFGSWADLEWIGQFSKKPKSAYSKTFVCAEIS